jgi:sugar lactone lactonase YvrE
VHDVPRGAQHVAGTCAVDKGRPSTSSQTLARAAAVACVAAAAPVWAQFSNFTPLSSSAGVTLNEAMPITFGDTEFTHFMQLSIADRNTQLLAGKPNTGNWDMITTNQTGPDAGRYLFMPFETAKSGVQRQDLKTRRTDTIWISPGDASSGTTTAQKLAAHVAFDASYWTPWGTYITAEENWTTTPGGATTNPYGRLFELTNPLAAPPITNPTDATSNEGANFFHRNVIPRVSHEGIQFDKSGNAYFIDELNGGSVYRYSPKADYADVLAGTEQYFAGGTTSVLRVGDGSVANATGAMNWVPFTDDDGNALSGAITITDPNGVTSVDGRNTTDLAAFKGTDYQRPEDLQIRRKGSSEMMFMATTTTEEVYVMNLVTNTISLFANSSTIDLATGLPVNITGTAFNNPDNLAMDSQGNIYIVEDSAGGAENDIWFAKDVNQDGDLLDTGEGLARWASNGAMGAEFTGLYFDPFNANRAWVNIQHPDSDNDRTIEITAVAVPEPSSFAVLAAGAGLLLRRRRAGEEKRL